MSLTPLLAAIVTTVVVTHLPAQTTPIVLQARALIDVERGIRIDDATVVVTGDRITAAGPASQVAVPPGARRIDLGSTTLLPA